MDKDINGFPTVLNHFSRICKSLESVKNNEAVTSDFSVSIAGLYNSSKRNIDIINEILELENLESDDTQDKLLEKIICLKINIYDECVSWIKQLRHPMKVVIDSIPDKL